VDWRSLVIETAWRNPLLWRGLRALHPVYTAARCRLRRRPRLRWVAFEVTNRCNLACVMCGSRQVLRERGLMSPETFEKVLAQIPDGSLYCVALHAVGEPLLHPNLEHFIRKARPKAAEIFLSTNGLLFHGDAEAMRRLLAAGLTHVHFSAEGYDAATYEEVRVGGRFDEFRENVRLFRRVRDASGSRAGIHLQYTLFRPHSADEIRRVKDAFGPFVDAIEFKPLNNQSSPLVAYRPAERIAEVRCYDDSPLPCLALWCGLTVLWDGRLSLCPRDHAAHLVIDDGRSPLAEAWAGEKARGLRSAHARRRFNAVCRDCFEPHTRTLAVVELDRRLNAIGSSAAT
jgi:uncharacterized Fe-S cluster-containing radical SAM superfamily protein